jgi:hypothetical protein
MHSANLTTAGLKRIVGLVFTLFIYSIVSAQENSPYSRYGAGDLVPNQNVVSRGMGGVAIGFGDYQSINFINPASQGYISNTILDLGGEVDIRTLKSISSTSKYTATNTLISYLQLGFPLLTKKFKKTDEAKNVFWGMSVGLRPISRTNYKIEQHERLFLSPLSDSLNTLNEGSGGINQINIGTGLRVKNFSIGFNTGYTFGNKDYSTKLEFINDTVIYQKSNTEQQSRFGGFFLNLGVQYAFVLNKGTTKQSVLNIGAYSNLQQNLKAKQDKIEESFGYDGNGGIYPIDTVTNQNGVKGTVTLPATYGAGFTYTNKHWLLGVDFETTDWTKYRDYESTNYAQRNWTIRAGAQYYPAKDNTAASRYWSFVKYRAGFYYGPDYIKISSSRPSYAATVGASFPLTSYQRIRYGEYVLLNTAVEIGSRGKKENLGLRENVTRISIGISMNARWFQRRSYD